MAQIKLSNDAYQGGYGFQCCCGVKRYNRELVLICSYRVSDYENPNVALCVKCLHKLPDRYGKWTEVVLANKSIEKIRRDVEYYIDALNRMMSEPQDTDSYHTVTT